MDVGQWPETQAAGHSLLTAARAAGSTGYWPFGTDASPAAVAAAGPSGLPGHGGGDDGGELEK